MLEIPVKSKSDHLHVAVSKEITDVPNVTVLSDEIFSPFGLMRSTVLTEIIEEFGGIWLGFGVFSF